MFQLIQQLPSRRGFLICRSSYFDNVMPMDKKISWLGCTFKARLNSGNVTWNGSQVMEVHFYCT